jgi:sulfocyanin
MLHRFFVDTAPAARGGWHRVVTGVLALAFVAVASACDAGEATSPSWMEVDAASKKVSFHFITAWSATNNGWNFNGYLEGGATVVVPVGWNVRITLYNQDGNYPHSMVVTKPYALDEMPDKATRQEAAISRAFTGGPENGVFAGNEDSLRFKAKKAGKYYLFCGVPGHGLSGMWIHLEISADADKPYVTIAEGVEPGAP